MNKKIQNLIKKLAHECANDDLGMSVSVVDEKGEVALAQAGNDGLVALSVYQQYEKQNMTCGRIIAIAKLTVL